MKLKIDGTDIILSRDIVFQKDGYRKRFKDQGLLLYNQSEFEIDYMGGDMEKALIKNLINFYEANIVHFQITSGPTEGTQEGSQERQQGI